MMKGDYNKNDNDAQRARAAKLAFDKRLAEALHAKSPTLEAPSEAVKATANQNQSATLVLDGQDAGELEPVVFRPSRYRVEVFMESVTDRTDWSWYYITGPDGKRLEFASVEEAAECADRYIDNALVRVVPVEVP